MHNLPVTQIALTSTEQQICLHSALQVGKSSKLSHEIHFLKVSAWKQEIGNTFWKFLNLAMYKAVVFYPLFDDFPKKSPNFDKHKDKKFLH